VGESMTALAPGSSASAEDLETVRTLMETIGRTVVLESLRKWNGSAHVTLSPGEYTQPTGGAGRLYLWLWILMPTY